MRVAAIVALAASLAAPSLYGAAQPDIAGAWTLNRDLSTLPTSTADNDRRPPEGGRGGYGGPGGGGRGGFGGGFGRPGGTGGGMNRPNEEAMRRTEAFRRHVSEVAERLIIVKDGSSVSVTDGNGRRMNYKTDGKKQDQLTGDGEFTTKSHVEGAALTVEEDFDGRKAVWTYTAILDGDKPRLEVVVKPEREPRDFQGGRGGRGGANGASGGQNSPRDFKRVYDLEARGPQG